LTGITPEDNLRAGDALRLRSALRAIRPPDDAERVFVDTIRVVSAHNQLVGPDCISILIPPPWHPQIRLRYISSVAATLEVQGRDDNAIRATAPAAFSPWIVWTAADGRALDHRA
jgi:hypothetical protein